ncbi:MAG: PhoH family protein [Elusimicrobiota bacterium]|jgi:phosphate starvation-inducible PhoH-like protein
MAIKRLTIADTEEALGLLGEQDVLLRQMEADFGVELALRQDTRTNEFILTIRGSSSHVDRAVKGVRQRLNDLRNPPATPSSRAHAGRKADPRTAPSGDSGVTGLSEDAVIRTAFGKVIRPRSKNQDSYVRAIQAKDLVFGIGPAGTGKTFLAVACALRALHLGKVNRIVLSRPVVEAGEKLGFLPGDLLEKVDPYLKPLYDAFYSMLGPQRFRSWRSDEVIEIVPLAYMRGRTFEDAFILLDEAQNTTPEQMKMFLTRMGSGSRVVVTGDITQTDLQEPVTSGLIRIMDVLKDVEGVSFCPLSEEDVVRHPLVRKIITAYERWDKTK